MLPKSDTPNGIPLLMFRSPRAAFRRLLHRLGYKSAISALGSARRDSSSFSSSLLAVNLQGKQIGHGQGHDV